MDDFSRFLAAAAIIDGQQFTLPGCGTLGGTYIPARVDHVARVVEPPSLSLSWSSPPIARVQSFADLLSNSGATSREATATEAEWIQTLLAGESISIGDLGTLELDEDTKVIEFTADQQGLRNAYWAGGAVSVEPLARRASPQPELAQGGAPTPPRARPRRATRKPSAKRAFRYVVPLLILAAVIGVAIGAWFLTDARAYFEGSQPLAHEATHEGKVVPVRNQRINRSPSHGAHVGRNEAISPPASTAFTPGEPATAQGDVTTAQSPALPDADLAIEATESKSTLSARSTEQPNKALSAASPDNADDTYVEAPGDFDPASLAGGPGDNLSFNTDAYEAVIILGSFGSKTNAARLVKRLERDGHTSYVDRYDKFTRVGVTVPANSEWELAAMLQRMQEDYNPNAWVKE